VVRWITRFLALALVVITVGAAGEVVVRAQDDVRTPTDAIVVLGASQYDGTPQPVFENRLRHAADVWFRNGGVLITVGGKLEGDRFTEAEAGRRYLIAQGIDADAVIAVPTGRDTWESVVAVSEVMAERGLESVTVVSDPAHVARSRAKFLHLGIARVEVSPTTSGAGSHLSSRYVMRETLGIMRFWLTTDWFRSGDRT
jgi:uncharacterized SAM-binding protein YcdF (DUF218 family)